MTNTWICGAFCAFFLVSCGNSQSASELHVVNGVIAEDGAFPAVVQIKSILSRTPSGQVTSYGECTSSIVSDNTILTAAHCIEDNGRLVSEIYAKINTADGLKEIRATKAKMHPKYRTTGTSYDVGVLVFADDTFSAVEPISVASTAPSINDEITIVGFGKSNHYDSNSGGKKRYGTNRITKVGETLDFVGLTKPLGDGTGERVLNSQGDSGGPMLWNNDLVGVSSSVDYRPGQVQTLAGHYRNLNYSEIKSFLVGTTSNFGARINGLSP